ncbi:MAG: hypothetical protein WBK77_00660 [Alphaproteobacteria bacterium]
MSSKSLFCHPRESGDPFCSEREFFKIEFILSMDSRLRGNDGGGGGNDGGGGGNDE